MLYVYWKRYVCEHPLIQLVNLWKNVFDQFAHTILINVSEASDCMPHWFLIARVKAYSVSNNACKFMK